MTVDQGASAFLESSGKPSKSPVSVSFANVAPEDTEIAIPSQSRIVAAREQRERLRVGTAEQEYISLSVIQRPNISQGPHPESRLMREEDEIGEGDDGRRDFCLLCHYRSFVPPPEYAEYTSAQERIALGKKARKVEASKRLGAMKEMIAEA